jgi:hypothetical protein
LVGIRKGEPGRVSGRIDLVYERLLIRDEEELVCVKGLAIMHHAVNVLQHRVKMHGGTTVFSLDDPGGLGSDAEHGGSIFDRTRIAFTSASWVLEASSHTFLVIRAVSES